VITDAASAPRKMKGRLFRGIRRSVRVTKTAPQGWPHGAEEKVNFP
jgi:hypothetical protein